MKTPKLMNALLASALVALAAGCAADDALTDGTANGSNAGTGKQVTITVGTAAGTSTRVAYDDDKAGSADNGALTWQAGDQLKVAGFGEADAYKGSEDYTIAAEDAGKVKAPFTGTEITDATTFNVYYPATVSIDATTGAATLALGTQVQEGDNSTAHLRGNILLQATGVTDLGNIELQMQSSIMKFSLGGIPAAVGTLKSLTWTAETTAGDRTMTLNFATDADNAVTFDGTKSDLTAYLAFLPGDMTLKAGGKFTVTLTGDMNYKAEMTATDGKTYAAGLRYTAAIDGTASTAEWQAPPVTIRTTLGTAAGYNYNGLPLQLGAFSEANSAEQVTLCSTTIADGKATITTDLTPYADKPIWVCIPGVVKFFHTLTAEEAGSHTLTLPDKDAGSTLKATPTAGGKPYENDWIVALYMGINKGGSTAPDATPLYWATGNLIATKTNTANSGATTTAFHIATPEETLAQASATSPYNTPIGISESAADGYQACAQGTQWNMFGWADVTGLITSTSSSNYAPTLTTTNGTSICGNAAYDIARKQLGGSWRLPTGGDSQATEIAAFADGDFSSLSPDGIDWKTGETYTGRRYTYTISNAGSTGNTISNTLSFPAAGYRNGATAYHRGSNDDYWSGTADGADFAYYLNFYTGNAIWYNYGRYHGFGVCSVSE